MFLLCAHWKNPDFILTCETFQIRAQMSSKPALEHVDRDRKLQGEKKKKKNSCFFLPSDRSAVLHAHPVHRPYRRGRETLFLSAEVSSGYPTPAHISGVPRCQPRGQGLSRLSHQTQRQIPALCGQWIWLPEQCSRETNWSDHAHEAAPR